MSGDTNYELFIIKQITATTFDELFDLYPILDCPRGDPIVHVRRRSFSIVRSFNGSKVSFLILLNLNFKFFRYLLETHHHWVGEHLLVAMGDAQVKHGGKTQQKHF